MSVPMTGLFAGLLLAIAAAAGGFGYFILAVVLGALGFIVGKALDGELDLSSFAPNANGRQR